ncbi:hypothetical protein TNCV_2773411 [Trichonephila clavipes]|nr:hypothetical protein TNCV_2773411 [Trichonephila clavipes]
METNLIWQSLIDRLHIISAACISMAPEVPSKFCRHTHPHVLFAICGTPPNRLPYLDQQPHNYDSISTILQSQGQVH